MWSWAGPLQDLEISPQTDSGLENQSASLFIPQTHLCDCDRMYNDILQIKDWNICNSIYTAGEAKIVRLLPLLYFHPYNAKNPSSRHKTIDLSGALFWRTNFNDCSTQRWVDVKQTQWHTFLQSVYLLGLPKCLIITITITSFSKRSSNSFQCTAVPRSGRPMKDR